MITNKSFLNLNKFCFQLMGHAKDVGQYLKDLFLGLQKKHKVQKSLRIISKNFFDYSD